MANCSTKWKVGDGISRLSAPLKSCGQLTEQVRSRGDSDPSWSGCQGGRWGSGRCWGTAFSLPGGHWSSPIMMLVVACMASGHLSRLDQQRSKLVSQSACSFTNPSVWPRVQKSLGSPRLAGFERTRWSRRHRRGKQEPPEIPRKRGDGRQPDANVSRREWPRAGTSPPGTRTSQLSQPQSTPSHRGALPAVPGSVIP